MKAKFLSIVALAMQMTLPAVPALADTLVGSWNVKHLGWSNEKDLGAVARIASAFDLLALQEVMSLEGLEDLEHAVETITGEPWEFMASEAIGRGSYREHYAFLWRSAEVSWVDGAVVYIDERDAFAREPFSMRFETADNYRFVLASAHLIYGDSVEEREREALALDSYHAWLTESFPETPIYIAGDFNLPPGNAAWDLMGRDTAPLIIQGATTLTKKTGRFANLYDNIWAPAGSAIPVAVSGIFDFPAELGVSHEVARDRISDHAPVWMLLDPSVSPIVLKPHSSGNGLTQAESREFAPASTGTGRVRGNKNSRIYHLADCPGYDRMSDRNLITFDSEAAAKEAGFRMARNCS